MHRRASTVEVPEIESKVLRWTIDDIMSSDLYKQQVGVIPMEFSSTRKYFQSFRIPLLEEVRAQLQQGLDKEQTAAHGVTKIKRIVEPNRNKVRQEDRSSKKYVEFHPPVCLAQMKYSDLILFCSEEPRWDAKRQCLQKPRAPHLLGFVVYADEMTVSASVYAENGSAILRELHKNHVWHVVVPGLSLTPARRIWQAISERSEPGHSVIHTILRADRSPQTGDGAHSAVRDYCDSRRLNESQRDVALKSVLAKENAKPPHVRIVQGPPGTGKTAMLVTLISVLVGLQCRTLVSAPTNAAVLELARRVMRFFDAPSTNHEEDFFGFCVRTKNRQCLPLLLRNVILLGSEEIMQCAVEGTALERIFIFSRTERLKAALNPTTGWKASVKSAVTLLTTAPALFEAQCSENASSSKKTLNVKFWRFAREYLVKLHARMKEASAALADELPQRHMNMATRTAITSATDLMAHLVALMPLEAPIEATTWFTKADHLCEAFRQLHLGSAVGTKTRFVQARESVLKALELSPGCSLFATREHPKGRVPSLDWLRSECIGNATLVFSTVSGAGSMQMMSLAFECAIIDEASQLVEAETAIIMRKSNLKQLILVGDHKQLPATVISNVAEVCGYKRSLFDRLQTLQHGCRHMLNVQYRMKPTISQFPNSQFYEGKVKNGPNVVSPAYGKPLLKAVAAYAFFDCSGGTEESEQKSWKNSKEVEAVTSLVTELGKVCAAKDIKTLSVGIISPYLRQVKALKKALNGQHQASLQVEVKTVDGFQGNERDVIIYSAVRSNHSRKIGFVDDSRRLNVAVTRGRYCVWIVGNASTLSEGGKIWKKLVKDAKARNCFRSF